MTKTDIAKNVVSTIVGFGTGSVVREIIKNNTAPEKVTDKVAIIIAGYVLGCIAADASKDWTDAKIDKLIAWWTENVNKAIPAE